MEFLKEYWYVVENIGVPILIFVGIVTLFSINFYALECMELTDMKKEINKRGNLKLYKDKTNYVSRGLFNPLCIFYIFYFLPNKDTKYYENTIFVKKVNTIRGYRKFYKIVLPIILILAIVGITLNETVMN